MKVAFFPGCMVDMLYPEVGIAAVNVLERLGCDLELPENQICCGRELFNSGYKKDMLPVAKKIIDAYDSDEYDLVVSLTGSCMNAIVNDYRLVFEDEPAYYNRTKDLSERCYEFTDFIVNYLGATDVGASFHESVTYHKSCNVTRLLGIAEPPLELLRNVEGLEYREMEHSERCCGFGGAFSFKQPEIAAEMAYEKCQAIIDTGANVVCGADVVCLMNIKGALGRMRADGRLDRDIRVMHIVQILDSRR